MFHTNFIYIYKTRKYKQFAICYFSELKDIYIYMKDLHISTSQIALS